MEAMTGSSFPELSGMVRVNAETECQLTINYLVNTVFAGQPVGAILLDGFRDVWLAADERTRNGCRIRAEARTPNPVVRVAKWEGKAEEDTS